MAAVLVGCGSSSGPAGDHTVVGVQAAAQEFSANLQAARYSAACEDLTASARASMARLAGGCAGNIPHYYLLLGKELNKWFRLTLPSIRVAGDAAYYVGEVQARYEGGRWHLESSIW
jgi:hypothetical protein